MEPLHHEGMKSDAVQTNLFGSLPQNSNNINIEQPRLLYQTMENTLSPQNLSPSSLHVQGAQEDYKSVKERNKKRKADKSAHELQVFKKIDNNILFINTRNSFAPLSDNPDMEDEAIASEPKPPPIYIPSIQNIQLLTNKLHINGINNLDYTYKVLNRNQIKLNANSGKAYSTIVKNLKLASIDFHTYQLKQDRAFRVVLRHIHHSMDVVEIKNELRDKGHIVRNICNVLRRLTKEPLSLFYVDLEPAPNNKEIYNIEFIQNARVQFEAPHTKRIVPQCKKCQRYGHTKTYCFRPFRCVKCGEDHDSAQCLQQAKNVLPNGTNGLSAMKCALCSGDHPASYKGCVVYQEIRKMKYPALRNKQTPTVINTETVKTSTQIPTRTPGLKPSIFSSTRFPSYAEAVKKSSDHVEGTNLLLDSINSIQQSFLELKQILIKQADQTTMLLSLLTTIVAKIK